ncbi:MAG TPA: nitroreductase family protein [Rheinheimera sp.]|nr:nitroreductase family protein [Rheinheimera sp.]
MDHEQHFPLTDYQAPTEAELQQRANSHLALMQQRHTIRSFSDRPVPREIIQQLIQIAASAPSGANHQPWHFVAISDPRIKKRIREEAELQEAGFYNGRAGDEWLDALKPLGTNAQKPYLETAPWLIVIFSQKRGGLQNNDTDTNYYVHESVGIATGFLIQACHQVGLVSLTHTPKPMSFLSKICDRDNDNDRPYMLLVVGYPAEDATVPAHALKKKPFEQICTVLE